MNGAEAIIQTAAKAGIEVCFANPGTTELPLVVALDRVAGIRPVLGLFEGCCTGAADGYGRLAGKPALTILHLGPGLANGLANLHNARRAGSPVVNLIGEHATWHRSADAPLTMDIQALAGTVSGWCRTITRVEEASSDMAYAIAAARSGMVASLIVAHDCQWTDYPNGVPLASPPSQAGPSTADTMILETITAQLGQKADRALILLGGRALTQEGLVAAEAICRKTGCRALVETFPACLERGRGVPAFGRLPYFPKAATEALASFELVLLAGARSPVSFFGYPGQPSRLLSDSQKTVDLAEAGLWADQALIQLAEVASAKGPSRQEVHPKEKSTMSFRQEKLNAQEACTMVAATQPENAIIVDESITSGGAYFELAAAAPRHSLLTLTGGSLGQGIPCAVGAAVACPDRPVINLQADGSALYTLQALWMQAKQGLNITTILFSNRSYDILKLELARAGGQTSSAAVQQLTDLDRPPIHWVKLSESMGVPGISVQTTSELAKEMQKAMAEPGPHLIVVNLEK